MKKLIVTILTLSFIMSSAFAGECIKNGKIISFNAHIGASDNFANTLIIKMGSHRIFFNEILIKSGQCFSPSKLYTGGNISFGQDLICKGELFVSAIYGQIVITKGAIDALIYDIGPASGWKCSR